MMRVEALVDPCRLDEAKAALETIGCGDILVHEVL